MLTKVFYILLVGVALLSVFYGGISVGIADCKRRFGIPKSAVGKDNDGYIYS